MEQSTQTDTPDPTAPADARVPNSPNDSARAAYRRASALASRLLDQMAVMPRAIEQFTEVGSSVYRVRLWFGYGLDAGRAVLDVAEQADVEVAQDHTYSGVYVEARATMESVPIIARALLTKAEAAELSGDPEPADEAPVEVPPAVELVPLGAGVLAEMPALVPVVPAPALAPGAEDEARCVRCGCAENAACEGGCYWVSNLQMVDLCSACATVEELAAITYTQAQPQEAPAEAPAPRLASPLMHRIPVIPAQETGQ